MSKSLDEFDKIKSFRPPIKIVKLIIITKFELRQTIKIITNRCHECSL